MEKTGIDGKDGETGATGPAGNGITSITKTGTSGLIDTYTIAFTNGTTTTYEVKNGEKGEIGPAGQDRAKWSRWIYPYSRHRLLDTSRYNNIRTVL